MEPRSLIRVAAGVIVKGNSVLACRRRPGITAQGKWEFPGGKIEPGENPEEALVREIEEELATKIRVAHKLTRDVTAVDDRDIELHCFLAVLVDGTPTTSTDHDELRWVDRADLTDLDWAAPDLPCVALLQARWPGNSSPHAWLHPPRTSPTPELS